MVQLDFSPRIPFLVCFQLGWAKKDILSVEVEDRKEAGETFQHTHAVIQLYTNLCAAMKELCRCN